MSEYNAGMTAVWATLVLTVVVLYGLDHLLRPHVGRIVANAVACIGAFVFAVICGVTLSSVLRMLYG